MENNVFFLISLGEEYIIHFPKHGRFTEERTHKPHTANTHTQNGRKQETQNRNYLVIEGRPNISLIAINENS